MKTGDVPKSVECYMNESGASEAEACEYVYSLMSQTWKKMNEQVLHNSSSFSQSFTEIAMNLARTALCMYDEHGDAYTLPNSQAKNRMLSLLIHPIPITY
ncbi:terpene synthase 10-like [Senna tora]|uniref:Terpene synthase 10-like n=1 Tax=Senna tora TaxID=362788 RepID=A0A834TPW8_9FABA|nr:terpene synthase 10-like [Senna tora]